VFLFPAVMAEAFTEDMEAPVVNIGLIEQRSGFGIPIESTIMTPSGWVTLGQVAAGDLVIDLAGRARRVRRLVPCGLGSTTEIHLRDGTNLTIGVGQPLPVEVGPQRLPMQLNGTQVTDLMARRVGVWLTNSDPIDMPGVGDRPVSAYLLGLLLGDGGLSGTSAVVLWTTETALRDRAAQLLPAGTRFSDHPQRQPRCVGWRIIGEHPGSGNPMLDALRQLGLSGCRAWEKRVPASYMWAPVEDRLAVLRGLLDSDGAVDPAGKITFSSSSPGLTRDVLHLVGTLGGRGTMHVRRGITYSVKGQPGVRPARDSYRLTLRMRDVPPFALERKAVRVRESRLMSQWQVAAIRVGGVAQLLTLDVPGPTASFLVGEGLVPVISSGSQTTTSSQHRAA
jgi:ATP-dependent DNA helicase RecG